MPRPPKKKTRVLAEAQRTGELRAERKHRAKTFSNKTQLQNWIVERLESILDRIDPLKLAAVLATTFIVKSGIDWGQAILDSSLVQGIMAFIQGKPIQFLIEEVTGMPKAEIPENVFVEWIISFAVAYFIVEHGDAIIDFGGDLLGVAKGFIGGLGGG